MKGLLSEEKIKNGKAASPWKKSDTTRMLELYLDGANPRRIAQELGRNPEAIRSKLGRFTYNQENLVINYKPFRRISRRGKRLTGNECLIIEAHRERNVPPEATANLLQRKINEILPDVEDKGRIYRMREVAPTLDLLLAYRYLYWCAKHPVVSNDTYDSAKTEELEYGGGADLLMAPASDKPIAYPNHIRSLALYLLFKHGEVGKLKGVLPPGYLDLPEEKK